MAVTLLAKPFDPWAELCAYQERLKRGDYGACASFVGTMRDFNQGDLVEAMFLEHYPGMTERELGRIVGEASARWGFLDALVIHRVGEIRPGDPIVLVAVWSAHRGPAFDACRFIVEALKARVPLWKKEKLPRGVRWVRPSQS
ncbi:MAG: molybdenum cofactor biosynthesis protein MoaE [Methylohalobius sp.]|nr:molybdenum cofactor biosynthesis protein MoaE [Methylohalobius sp.]